MKKDCTTPGQVAAGYRTYVYLFNGVVGPPNDAILILPNNPKRWYVEFICPPGVISANPVVAPVSLIGGFNGLGNKILVGSPYIQKFRDSVCMTTGEWYWTNPIAPQALIVFEVQNTHG